MEFSNQVCKCETEEMSVKYVLLIYVYDGKQYILKISLFMSNQIHIVGKLHLQQFFFLPMMQVDTAKPLCVEDLKRLCYP